MRHRLQTTACQEMSAIRADRGIRRYKFHIMGIVAATSYMYDDQDNINVDIAFIVH